MHAFLVIGNQINKINKKVSEISSNLAAKPYNFKLEKIEDTRELRKLVKLSLETPRVYIIKDIDKATNEATNAFLKSLEEPHKNTYFILTAQSLFNVIGTISSRCQLIFTTINNELTPQEETQISNFLKGTISDKFSQIDSIRKREEAIAFTSLLIKAFYKLIINSYSAVNTKNIKYVIKCYNAISANGNVNLHLSQMAIRITNLSK